MAVSSAINAASSASAATAATSNSGATIAKNFQTFLQLLTTQLRHQNPLEPLNTNEFTQQLVQFAQVEQQIATNTSLGSLLAMQQATQSAAAMNFLGATVRVSGDTAKLASGAANWTYTVEKAATATINIQNSAGELVHTENRTLNAGPQTFTWNGRDAEGRTLPDGDYKISIVARDASAQAVAVSTEVEGVVDGVDVNQSPPVLSVGTQTFTLDKIRQVRRPAS